MSAARPDAAAAPASSYAAPAPGNTAAAAVPKTGDGAPAATGGAAGAHRTTAQIAMDIVLFFAAPFVTLAYLALFPFIGIRTLVQAWRQRKETA